MANAASIDFGIGTIHSIWKAPDNGDIVITISFHQMTFEDVVLIVISVVPALCLLWHLLFSTLPEWWSSLKEKAERDDMATMLATNAFNGDGRDGSNGSFMGNDNGDSGSFLLPIVGIEAGGYGRKYSEDGICNGGGDNGTERGASGGATRPTRPPTRPGRSLPAPSSLPAPEGSCAALFSCLPAQLRPRSMAARARSFFTKPGGSMPRKDPLRERLMSLLQLCGSCVCCAFCASIMHRILPPDRNRPRFSAGGRHVKHVGSRSDVSA